MTIKIPTSRDWEVDRLHEGGYHALRCLKCENVFMGHKRRLRCRLCSQPAPASLLAESVARMEMQNKEYRELLGYIIATVRVNRIRGTITSVDEKDFDRVEEGWRAAFDRINGQSANAELSGSSGPMTC